MPDEKLEEKPPETVEPATTGTGVNVSKTNAYAVYWQPGAAGTRNVTKTVAYAVVTTFSNLRLTQVATEALEKGGNPNLRLTQIATEALERGGNPNLRLTQIATEILAKGISVSCGNPPHGTVGTAYTTTFPTQGGTAPLLFAVTLGSLPKGLTLNATTGVLSGTPAKGGTFSFTITVTDSSTVQNIKTYAPPPSVSPGGAAAGAASYMGINTLGQQYWSIAVAFETPVTPPANATGYSVTVQDTDQFGNPSPDYFGTERLFFSTGVTGSTTTSQVLLGGYQSVPTSPYSYITFRAYQNNSDGSTTPLSYWPGAAAYQRVGFGTPPSTGPAPIQQPVGSGSVSCSITIGLGTLAASCGTPPAAAVGAAFSYRPPVTIGGVLTDSTYDSDGTLSWNVTGLPPGLRWDNSTGSPTYGSIAGTPTAQGTFTYSAVITSSDSQTATINCPITVGAAGSGGGGGGGGGGSGPGVCGSPPQAIVGLPWTFMPPFTTGVGAPAITAWTFQGLPPGIGWDTNPLSPTYGFLTGIVSEAGTYNYSASYIGAGGTPITFACSIVAALPGVGGLGEDNTGGAGSCLWISLSVWLPLFAVSSLNQQLNLPPAYERALRYALARELATWYPARDPAKVTQLAVEAELAVDGINTSNQLAVEDAPQPAIPPAAQGGA